MDKYLEKPEGYTPMLGLVAKEGSDFAKYASKDPQTIEMKKIFDKGLERKTNHLL